MVFVAIAVLSIVLLLDILCLSYQAENGLGFWGVLGFISFWLLIPALLRTTLGLDVKDLILTGWPYVLGGFVAYLVTGMVWTVFKWWRYARRTRTKLQDWLIRNPVPTGQDPAQFYIRASKNVKFLTGIQYLDGKFKLLASQHKTRIIRWLALWPFSMLGTLINDLMIRLWETIYELLGGVYQRISDFVFADVEAPQ